MVTFPGSWTGTESDQAAEDPWPNPAGLTIDSGLEPGRQENGLPTKGRTPSLGPHRMIYKVRLKELNLSPKQGAQDRVNCGYSLQQARDCAWPPSPPNRVTHKHPSVHTSKQCAGLLRFRSRQASKVPLQNRPGPHSLPQQSPAAWTCLGHPAHHESCGRPTHGIARQQEASRSSQHLEILPPGLVNHQPDSGHLQQQTSMSVGPRASGHPGCGLSQCR